MKKKYLLKLFSVITILALLFLGYLDNFRYFLSSQKNTSENTSISNQIDFFATNTETKQYNETGLLEYKLVSEKIEHSKSTSITTSYNPTLTKFQDNDNPPVTLKSKEAQIKENGEEIDLINDVNIVQIDSNLQPIVLNTEFLTVYPNNDYAKSNEFVTITSSSSKTSGIGMEAFFKDSQLKLHNNVQTIYDYK